jgi:hypothetical protein
MMATEDLHTLSATILPVLKIASYPASGTESTRDDPCDGT